ncbi:MAG TPA: phosphoenolpyruvate synthase [Sandaracinaceae bacterium LLY-WYZ-13_1]|nr:phosphoenolpyruvate synthase [Sandaracinaceae bacterium LLY-WYZ-13_1]
MSDDERYVRFFDELGSGDVAQVGGKNASLGEMIRALEAEGIRVPGGFATTASAYRRFLDHNELNERLREELAPLADGAAVEKVGPKVRALFEDGEWPEPIAGQIREAYRQLSSRHEREDLDVAVRSSATAEDLPDASFAGQQETFLNVRGEDDLLDACRRCYASLFTDRAIGYREEKGFDHLEVALSVGVQQMVRSDRACAGVLFTIDTDSGFPDVIVINGSWGLGESVVSGTVDPDELQVYAPLLDEPSLAPIVEKKRGTKETKIVYSSKKGETTREEETSEEERIAFVLDDEEILQLARWGRAIEAHYGRPMDIEWAKDGDSERIFIVQARPETVQSQRAGQSLRTYALKEKGEPKVTGLAIGNAIGAGEAFVLESADQGERFEDDGVLVTTMTDPDWVPIMRRASAIVTDHGGRTSHAAIVSRELGVPAVIGAGDATEKLADGDEVTVSCAEGEEGFVYEGILAFETEEIDLSSVPETETEVMVNLANPDAGHRWWNLPADGVGLARMEFLIGNVIRVHPMALVDFDRVEDEDARARIEALTRGYEDRAEYFVDTLARGIAKIGASRYPKPVVVRFSDFKTNEYADLVGGAAFEPAEANPMLGFRGASRYYDESYRPAFALECRAIRRAREEIGLDNVIAMVPFCRTLDEADRVLEVLAAEGLERGRGGFQLYVMAEIPANVILAREFARRFDGFSIGSNDLTQLVLGVDRDSDRLAHLFDERNEAVKRMIRTLVSEAHAEQTKVGLCGQAPSDHPDFAAFLVEVGIDSISVDPTSLVDVKRVVKEAEAKR